MSSTVDKNILYLVLEAINKGCRTDRCIFSKLSGLSQDLIRNVIRWAIENGYIVEEEKGRIIKKKIYKMTDKGVKMLSSLKDEVLRGVHKTLNETRELVMKGLHEEAKKRAEKVKDYVPALAALGMIEDALLLSFFTDAFGLVISMMLTEEVLEEELEELEEDEF